MEIFGVVEGILEPWREPSARLPGAGRGEETMHNGIRSKRSYASMRSTFRIAALAALAAVAVAAPVAQAGGPPPAPDRVFREGGVKYVQKRITSGIGSDVAGVQVPCGGKRWRAVGGGADLVQGFAPAVYLLQSSPFDWNAVHGGDADQKPDDGWEVFLREEAGPDLLVDVWAICVRRGAVRYRRDDEDIGMGEGATARASCRRRDSVLGGGFFIVPVLVTEASILAPFDGGDRGSRPDDGWTVHGFNHTGIGSIVGAHAICGRDKGLSYRSKAAAAPSMLATRSPTARCKGRAHALSGGGSVGSGHIVESHPIDGPDRGKAPDDGWQVTLVTAAGFKTRAFAVCRK